jgi:hypothetical protein
MIKLLMIERLPHTKSSVLNPEWMTQANGNASQEGWFTSAEIHIDPTLSEARSQRG